MKHRIDVLQYGRGLAALAVVAHHATLAANSFNGDGGWLGAILIHGDWGVDFSLSSADSSSPMRMPVIGPVSLRRGDM